MSLFSVSKEISDLIHDGETDYDAPVKVLVEGIEYVVTDVNYEMNISTGEATVWLTVEED